MIISVNVPKAVCRQAIDAPASDGEGAAWWNEAADEIQDVAAARSIGIAAELIVWQRDDWTCINDSPTIAPKQIRHAAHSFGYRA
jgi:sugar phosphate isomerase/epimerase